MTSPVQVPDLGSSSGQGGTIYGIVTTGTAQVVFLNAAFQE
jgi:hypothetical protein